jgi:hypothetical protein
MSPMPNAGYPGPGFNKHLKVQTWLGKHPRFELHRARCADRVGDRPVAYRGTVTQSS